MRAQSSAVVQAFFKLPLSVRLHTQASAQRVILDGANIGSADIAAAVTESLLLAKQQSQLLLEVFARGAA